MERLNTQGTTIAVVPSTRRMAKNHSDRGMEQRKVGIPNYFRICLAEKLSGLSALEITTMPLSETVNPRLRSSSIS